MSPVVLQLLPMPPAHVAGFSFPLNSNYTVEWNSNAWCCYCPSKCYEDQTHHSHSEKKIFFPYFFMALLILVYLHEPWQFTSQSNTSDPVHWYCPICDIVLLTFPWHSCQHHCSYRTSDNQLPGVETARITRQSGFMVSVLAWHEPSGK
jgi:hypothetical protein